MKFIYATVMSLSIAGAMFGPAALADDDSATGLTMPDPAVVLVAEAGDEAAKGHHHGGWHAGGFGSLTDDQLAKLADIREAAEEKTAGPKGEMHALKYQLHKLMLAPTVDKAQALSIQSKINALNAEIANARLSSLIDARGVLTPEQTQHMRHMMLMHMAFKHGMGPAGCGPRRGPGCEPGRHPFGPEGHGPMMFHRHMDAHMPPPPPPEGPAPDMPNR